MGLPPLTCLEKWNFFTFSWEWTASANQSRPEHVWRAQFALDSQSIVDVVVSRLYPIKNELKIC